MKKVLFLMVAILFLIGCKQTVCPSPYIFVGTDCCLDENANKICDKDEAKKETSTVTITEEKPKIIEKEVKKYVCSDGSVVEKVSDCPIEESKPIEEPEPEFVIPDLVDTNEEGTVIEQVSVATACEYGEQGGDIYFKVGTLPDNITVEMKEVGQEYTTVYERRGLFDGHIRFVICDDCIRGDYRIKPDKVYILRMMFDQTNVWKRIEYSNEFLIDTGPDSVFMTKICSK